MPIKYSRDYGGKFTHSATGMYMLLDFDSPDPIIRNDDGTYASRNNLTFSLSAYPMEDVLAKGTVASVEKQRKLMECIQESLTPAGFKGEIRLNTRFGKEDDLTNGFTIEGTVPVPSMYATEDEAGNALIKAVQYGGERYENRQGREDTLKTQRTRVPSPELRGKIHAALEVHEGKELSPDLINTLTRQLYALLQKPTPPKSRS